MNGAWRFGPELVGDQAPLGACRLGVVLDEGGHDAPALPASMGEQVAHEVHAGAVEKPGYDARRASVHVAGATTSRFRTVLA